MALIFAYSVGPDPKRTIAGIALKQQVGHMSTAGSRSYPDATRLAEIVRERKIDHVVAGVPRRMNGQIGTAATEVLQFVEKLRAILPCPVVTWDERLTTVAAQRALRDAGKKTRDTRGYIDQVAAQMILQSYLDRRAADTGLKSDL